MFKENDLISVIMPAYNAENTLQKAVDSVLAQTYQHLELIIVNDCSKDRTLAVAQEYAKKDLRVRVISNTVNSGVSVTRHKAVQEARGEWIAFLDSDDAWKADKLEKQIERQRQTNGNLIFTGSSFMDAEGNPIDWMLHVPKQIDYKKLLKQNLISNSSVLVLKSCYQKFEAMGDAMHEDFACWLKMLRSGEIAYGIDEPLLIYRLSSDSKSGNKRKAAKMNWNTYRAVGLNPFEAGYYMIWYTINGIKKYGALKNQKKQQR